MSDSEDLTPEQVLDGFALWREHMPQSADDWLGVARRVLADGEDGSAGSPLFHALCKAVALAHTHEMRATMAEEAAADLRARKEAT